MALIKALLCYCFLNKVVGSKQHEEEHEQSHHIDLRAWQDKEKLRDTQTVFCITEPSLALP